MMNKIEKACYNMGASQALSAFCFKMREILDAQAEEMSKAGDAAGFEALSSARQALEDLIQTESNMTD